MLLVAALLCSAVIARAVIVDPHRGGEGFSVKEYEDFHRVLHGLQHEALPRKDFARIRSQAAELVKLGQAIVEIGVPPGTTSSANVEEFKQELKKFSAALAKFSADAKADTDEQLTVSFSAVHDSFETLADMLPR